MSVHVLTATALAVGVVVLCSGSSASAQAEEPFQQSVEQRPNRRPYPPPETTVYPNRPVYPAPRWAPPVAWIPPDAGNYAPAPRYYPTPYPPQYRPAQPLPPVAPYPGVGPAVDPRVGVGVDARRLQDELAASRVELQRTNERLQAAQMLLQQARDALARNYSEHQQQRSLQADQTAQLNLARDQVEAAQARVSGLTDELETVRSTLAEQQAQLAEYSALKQDFAAQQAAAQQLHEHSLQLDEQRAFADSQFQACQERLTVLDDDLTKAQTAQATTERSLADALAERDRLQSALGSATAELEARQTELTRAAAAASEAIAQRDAVQAQLAALETDTRKENTLPMQEDTAAQSAALTEQLHRAEVMLDAELSTKTAMQKALADATSTRERLLAQLDSLNARLAGAQSQQQANAQVQRVQGELQQQLLACNERLAAAKIAFSTSGVLAAAPTATRDTSVAASGRENSRAATPAELAALEPAAGRVVDADNAGADIASADIDADGVPDRLDLCPDSPRASVVDATGCAPNVPIVLTGINFRYDSDALTAASRTALDQVAGILREQPTLRLEIAGHSDTQGNAAYNLWLSEQRARSVMAYLVAKGVQADRLRARGYGGAQPIAENTTREGLALNRRVELRRLP